VTGITRDGLWVLVEGREYFIAFSDYPAFADATVQEIYGMRAIAPGQLRWDSIDCDIEVAALDAPAGFPLVYK
jgi:hypothetical protein